MEKTKLKLKFYYFIRSMKNFVDLVSIMRLKFFSLRVFEILTQIFYIYLVVNMNRLKSEKNQS